MISHSARTYGVRLFAVVLLGLSLGCSSFNSSSRIPIGVCTGLGDAAELKPMGFDFIEGGVWWALNPKKSDAEWADMKRQILESPLPMISCNGFLPGEFKVSDPRVDFTPALDYAEKACRRADEIGLRYIVFGSGGARRFPADLDRAVCRARFVEFCRALAARIGDCRVTIVFEPLNRRECNFLNTVAEGIELVDEIDSPRFRQLADIYHMLVEGEGPESLVKAGDRLCHVHIAELNGRTWPGCNGEDFGPYFAALRKIGYKGGVSIEGGLPKGDAAEQAVMKRRAADCLESALNGGVR